MVPTLQSINVESSGEEFFLLCTLKVPISKNSNAFSMINLSGPKFLEADPVKAHVCKLLCDRSFKEDECSEYIETVASSVKTIAEQSGNTSTTMDSHEVAFNSDVTPCGSENTLSTEVASTDLSMTESPLVKQDAQVNASKTAATEAKCMKDLFQMSITDESSLLKEETCSSQLLTNNCTLASERQLCTWGLNQQNQTTNYLFQPVSLPANEKTPHHPSEKEPLPPFIDLAESFGLTDMRTPIHDVDSLSFNSSRDFYRNYSTCSNSSSSDLEGHFEDFVRDLDGDNHIADVPQLSEGMGNAISPQSDEDAIDFQALIAALSSPIEDCSADAFTQILEDEITLKQKSHEMNSEAKINFLTSKGNTFHGVEGDENPIYQDITERDQDFDQYKKKPGPRKRPNQCYHLWDFLRDELSSENDYMEWVSQENREFRILDTKKIANAWGNKKRSRNMNYDKLSRSLRYYCKLSILEKVKGKRLHFRFGEGKMWTKV